MATAATTLTKLVERVGGSPGRVDRQAGVIRGVRILGKHSKNGRVYSDNAMRQAVTLYDGRDVVLDHDRTGMERKFESAVGILENVRLERGAVYGDLRLHPSHPKYGLILDRAEAAPGNFGLSHEADGNCKYLNGQTVVESLNSVDRIALVCDPATNIGLFESHTKGNDMIEFPKTVEEFVADLDAADAGFYHLPTLKARRLHEDAHDLVDAKGRVKISDFEVKVVNLLRGGLSIDEMCDSFRGLLSAREAEDAVGMVPSEPDTEIPESTDWKTRSLDRLLRKTLAERGLSHNRLLDKFPETVEAFNAGL